jgi:hypothetical protein
MVISGEKLGGGPVDQLAGMLGIVSRVLSLESSRFHPTLLMASERLPRTRTVRIKCVCGICGLAWEVYVSYVSSFPLQGVHHIESP